MLDKIAHSLTTNTFRSLRTLMLFISLCGVGQAATSYQQNPISGGNAIFANASSGAINADNFTITNAINLESFSWWGSYDVIDTDNFIINLYTNANGVPGSLIKTYSGISVTATLAGLSDSNAALIYRYDFTVLQPLALPAASYYLSITNETTLHSWFWLTGSGGDSQHKTLAANGSTWVAGAASDLAFIVNSVAATTSATSVPIPPGFLVLMMAGIVFLGWVLQNPVRRR
jgi:hypothetical protein